MCLGFVRNFGSFFAVRALLGLAEGGLLPGMVLYLSGLYTRAELALRIGIFYTAASLSGAFGGTHYPNSSLGNALAHECRTSRSRTVCNCPSRRTGRVAMDLHYRRPACKQPYTERDPGSFLA